LVLAPVVVWSVALHTPHTSCNARCAAATLADKERKSPPPLDLSVATAPALGPRLGNGKGCNAATSLGSPRPDCNRALRSF
jgi:hypothetical protein